MQETTFRKHMMELHELFESEAFARARTKAAALRAALETGDGNAEQRAWACFYELKSLHAEQDWAGLIEAMRTLDGTMAAAGPTNHSYVRSLTMEACYQLDDGEGVAHWALACASRRLGHDEDSFEMAVRSAKNLLEELDREDLLVELMLRFSALGFARGAPKLAVSAQTIAIERATELGDAALLERARTQLIERGAAWLPLALEAHAQFGRLRPFLVDPEVMAAWPPAMRATLAHGSEMFTAASGGDREQTLAILATASDPNLVDDFGRTALSAAAFAGHRELVEALLKMPGIDVNRDNLQRRAPLAQAADQGFIDIVQRLLAAGADPDQRDFNQQTPLMIAAWQDHAETVAVLLAAGARPELVDRTSNTALHLAASSDAAAAVAALIEGGAEVDATTELGHTPLMKAAMEGKDANVALLLAAGARREPVDIYGLSASAWAAHEGFPALAARLDVTNGRRTCA